MSGVEKLLVFQRGGRLNRSERRNKRTKTEIFFSLLKKYWGQTKNLPAPQAKRRGRQERKNAKRNFCFGSAVAKAVAVARSVRVGLESPRAPRVRHHSAFLLK